MRFILILICEERGDIDTKNVGKISMYYVKRIKKELCLLIRMVCVPNNTILAICFNESQGD